MYLSFEKSAKKAIAEEISDEVFLRYDPNNRKIADIEILDFRRFGILKAPQSKHKYTRGFLEKQDRI